MSSKLPSKLPSKQPSKTTSKMPSSTSFKTTILMEEDDGDTIPHEGNTIIPKSSMSKITSVKPSNRPSINPKIKTDKIGTSSRADSSTLPEASFIPASSSAATLRPRPVMTQTPASFYKGPKAAGASKIPTAMADASRLPTNDDRTLLLADVSKMPITSSARPSIRPSISPSITPLTTPTQLKADVSMMPSTRPSIRPSGRPSISSSTISSSIPSARPSILGSSMKTTLTGVDQRCSSSMKTRLLADVEPKEKFTSMFRSARDEEMGDRQTIYNTLTPAEQKKQDAWAMGLIMENKPCPERFDWIRREGGYQCSGRGHGMTDDMLAEGYQGVLILRSHKWDDKEGPYRSTGEPGMYLFDKTRKFPGVKPRPAGK